ncbi:MAG: aminotransferase class V [Betaproteobacteria bacterium HGW-Betaproteobacteria-1]|nr:MAG: aminotransferase class V [Betaproteobacteria bacterium HGW-Betaproteobacteria-1]
MTTSNTMLPGFADLSSFEPEAILAAMPGEHPKMTAALETGRHAEATGHLDVKALEQIVNELYAEGFPNPAKIGQSFNMEPDLLATDSFPDPHVQATGSQQDFPGLSDSPASFLSSSSTRQIPAVQPDPENLRAAQLQYMSDASEPLVLGSLPAGAEIPYASELKGLLAEIGNDTGSSSAASAMPAKAGQFYFIDAADISVSQFAPSAHPPFDINLVRRDFPILNEQVNGRPLIWFDNAATTQKPQVVIDRISYFYQHENSNIHRAAHELAARATDAYEEARESVRRFINAPSSDNVIFVRGTTEAINLVAKSWGKKHLGEGDEILISHLEHHANIVPWQQLCQETGANLKVAPVDDTGQILLDEYQKLVTSRTKLVSFTQVSNALGTVTPAAEMIQIAHQAGARVLLDGAQSVSHMRVDVQALNPDFFVFSGHKVFGPTGIGALYGKADVLKDMPVWQGGGNMIQDVTFEKTVYHEAPNKFEAGTGNIADAVGLGAALEYVERIGIENIARYEHELLVYAIAALEKVPGLHLFGTAKEKASVLSFNLDGYKSEEVGAALNEQGIAVRSGHHCAQPILRRFGQETTVRPSLAFYNTYAEIDVLCNALHRLASAKHFN